MALCFKHTLHKVLRPTYVPVRTKKRSVAFKQYRRKNDSQEVARDYFDNNYEKVFESEWPAIRCAMLSRKKYCAVLNNSAYTDDYEEKLVDSESYNFIAKLNEKAALKYNEVQKTINDISNEANSSTLNQDTRLEFDAPSISERYVDVEESLEHLNLELAVYKQLQSNCAGVRAYIYPKSNFSEFLPTVDNSCFLLDGSSILPILALDPRPADQILDMCSSPGGKLNVMIQALGNSGHIVANDILKSRINQIQKVFKRFYPPESAVTDRVKFEVQNGTTWNVSESYSKVLVDVPCTNDRKSVYTPESDVDNIFSESRKRERSRLPELQSLLLLNAIQACQVGGTVVYTTATASPLQNQYVVQYTVQEALQSHNIVCEVEDLSLLTNLLEDDFYFQKNINLGALVFPRLDSNFGPTYVCKLRRQS